MSNDFSDIIFRKEPGSDILRVYSNAAVVIYEAGTTTPIIASGTADADGIFNIASLDTGHYDIWIDGTYRSSFHHVKADYVTKHPKTLTFLFAGTISGDIDEDENHHIHFIPVAGKILGVTVVVHSVDATADATIHLLKGSPERAGVLTAASDSIWSVQCNPQSALFDWSHHDASPGLDIEAQKNIAAAIDYTAGTVKGVTITLLFKED